MEVIGDLGGGASDGLIPGGGLVVEEQAGDLVLVLVRHQLVEVDHHGAGELVVLIELLLGSLSGGDDRAESSGVFLGLIVDQVARQSFKQLQSCLRCNVYRKIGRPFDLLWVVDPRTSPTERIEVLGNCDAVEFDGALNCFDWERQGTALNSGAEHEEVGSRRRSEQTFSERRCVEKPVVIGSSDRPDSFDQVVTAGQAETGLGDHGTGRDGIGRSNHDGAVDPSAIEVRCLRCNQEVKPEDRVDA